LAEAVRTAAFRVERAAAAWALGGSQQLAARVEQARAAFAAAMDDDLNTAAAIGELFALVAEMNRHLAAVDAGNEPLDVDAVAAVGTTITELLGLLLISVDGATSARTLASLTPAEALATWRQRLAAGEPLPAALARDHYRAQKDWSKSDEIRDALQASGFEVRDTKQGTQVVRKD
jgi:cysteinyl-tRNA synthetase